MTVFNPTIEVVTFCLHGRCMLGVFIYWTLHVTVTAASIFFFFKKFFTSLKIHTSCPPES